MGRRKLSVIELNICAGCIDAKREGGIQEYTSTLIVNGVERWVCPTCGEPAHEVIYRNRKYERGATHFATIGGL